MKTLAASTALVAACSVVVLAQTPPAAAQTPHRIYDHLLDPREHPDYDRRPVKPPSWDTFDNQTQFATLRGFGVENNKIVGFADEIEKYTRTFELGNVLWPSYPIVFADNLAELVDEIKKRNLFLFDIWGYVPGSGPGGYWTQYRPPKSAFELMESRLGDHWLGMDVGEQDGRYVGGYAGQMCPISDDRFEQYLNFQRHFERMGDELGNKLSTLVSLNFGHYFLKEGLYTTIGAETAQALPNSQIYYAFIRGAGKQYGVPWFGNASVFNRWGYKTYGSDGPDHSPTKGSSLNLMKRLLYNHILYNSVFVGFESGWFEGDTLSPLGKIQQAAQRWVRENGQPGVTQTPIALLLDFHAGWTFPRHLYSGNVYRVWGNVPYAPGDYLTDGVLDMFYPGYQNSSYFHDEAGFIVETPYGDSVDCLLTDAPLWLLNRYSLVVVAGGLTGGAEIRDKLEAYVREGGHLIITAGNLASLPGGLGGVTVGDTRRRFDKSQSFEVDQLLITEEMPFELATLRVPEGAWSVSQCVDTPAVVKVNSGKGHMTVLASPFGLSTEPAVSSTPNDVDKPLPKPYPLLAHVRATFDQAFRAHTLFSVGEGLSVIVCRKSPGEYTLCVCNNTLQPKPFEIVSHCGLIESVTERPLDQSEKGAIGYVPEGFEKVDVGVSNEKTVAGGDVRIFAVKIREENVVEIPRVAPPPRPRGRILPLRGNRSIKEELLARPTFFEHYDGVCIDWHYLHDRDIAALQRESAWVARQGLRVIVDLSSGINLFPDLRFVNNSPEDFAASMAVTDDVLKKMSALGARDLIVCLHREPENNFTGEQTRQSFESTLKDVCARAAGSSITVHLRVTTKWNTDIRAVAALVETVGAPNLRIAASTALLLRQDIAPADLASILKEKLGLWLVSSAACDPTGTLWTTNMPVWKEQDRGRISDLLRAVSGAPLVFDAVYKSIDEEYADARAMESLPQS